MQVPEEMTVTVDEDAEWVAGLAKLREPFPPERIEKLPKPLWKGAWDDQPKSQCDVCGGYHARANTIHLDYVGHANCTDRLLEVDPCWDWQPLAYNADGLPLFDRSGGLWIKLTILGVTRLGYGDGASVKEIIGDAIRNAAMRFGVALDLWAKVDLHEGINPSTPARRPERMASGSGGRDTQRRDDVAAAAPPRPNQAALDALEIVCKKHGYSTQYCIDRFWSDYDIQLKDAAEELIFAFADILIGEATAEPDAGVGDEGAGQPAADAGVEGAEQDSAAVGGDESTTPEGMF